MDVTMGIAKLSMDMAAQKTATESQTAVLKQSMDVQKESMAILLQSLGVGRNLSVQA
ncbi:MAG: YjfB family protein [Synergistaceae bacterium]|jgi:hypothetical protein|nr:YjfB family protein [Synergistaceae bacterium]